MFYGLVTKYNTLLRKTSIVETFKLKQYIPTTFERKPDENFEKIS